MHLFLSSNMAAVMSGALKPIMGLFGDLAYSKNITLMFTDLVYRKQTVSLLTPYRENSISFSFARRS